MTNTPTCRKKGIVLLILSFTCFVIVLKCGLTDTIYNCTGIKTKTNELINPNKETPVQDARLLGYGVANGIQEDTWFTRSHLQEYRSKVINETAAQTDVLQESQQKPKESPTGANVRESKVTSNASNNYSFIGYGSYIKVPVSNDYIYITTAYLDTRFNTSKVRVFGMKPLKMPIKVFCAFNVETDFGNVNGKSQTAYSDKSRVDSRDNDKAGFNGKDRDKGKAEDHGKAQHYGTDNKPQQAAHEILIDPHFPPTIVYVAAMWTCNAPKTDLSSVSLVIGNISVPIPIKLRPKPVDPKQVRLSLCLKCLYGNVDVERLIEWIEVHRLVGIEHFTIHLGQLDNPRALELIQSRYKGIITWVSFSFTNDFLDDVLARRSLGNAEHFSLRSQSFLLSFNDCLFSSAGYSHVLSLDYDELLLPIVDTNLHSMLKRVIAEHDRNGSNTGFVFPTAWYFDDWGPPTRRNQTRHYYVDHRTRTVIGFNQPKSIVATSDVLLVNWHSVTDNHERSKIRGTNENIINFIQYGYVHHFRRSCIEKFVKVDCDGMAAQMESDKVLPNIRAKVTKLVEMVLSNNPIV